MRLWVTYVVAFGMSAAAHGQTSSTTVPPTVTKTNAVKTQTATLEVNENPVRIRLYNEVSGAQSQLNRGSIGEREDEIGGYGYIRVGQQVSDNWALSGNIQYLFRTTDRDDNFDFEDPYIMGVYTGFANIGTATQTNISRVYLPVGEPAEDRGHRVRLRNYHLINQNLARGFAVGWMTRTQLDMYPSGRPSESQSFQVWNDLSLSYSGFGKYFSPSTSLGLISDYFPTESERSANRDRLAFYVNASSQVTDQVSLGFSYEQIHDVRAANGNRVRSLSAFNEDDTSSYYLRLTANM